MEQHFPSRVNRVNQNSNMDQQADRVGRVSQVGQVTRVSPSSSTDQRTDQVSWVNHVSYTEQKKGGSNCVANTESQITKNSANTKSQIMKNSTNTENRVTQDSGSKKPEDGKCAAPRKRPAPWWCPRPYQDTKTQIAKDASKRVGREKRGGRAGLLVSPFMAHDQAHANVVGKVVSQGGRL
jgi:hypothetical protein